MKIFVSWSKRISMEFSIRIKQLLENIDPTTEVFVSEMDIVGGEDVQRKIIENINICDKLILCFTSDTKKSPWLLFEAGYARGCGKTVIPLLFDNDPNWHSWIDNPMNIAREVRFNSNSFVLEFMRALSIKNTERNRKKIEKFQTDILDIKNEHRTIDVECEDLIDSLISNGSFFVENPYYRDKTAFF